MDDSLGYDGPEQRDELLCAGQPEEQEPHGGRDTHPAPRFLFFHTSYT